MGLLDKLKPQPRWKHADPAVRLEAVAELDDPSEIAALAERDVDPQVRRAAIAKVGDPSVLGRVTAADADPRIRDAAADRLLALALDPSLPEAVTAASLLSDVRRVSAVAKGAAGEAAREAALAKLTDERALGGVARHAQAESTALAAALRLTSAEEQLSTVLNSTHREVALAVFDRLVDPGAASGDVTLLETIAARTQQKAVARRAKAMLQAIADAENARRTAEAERQKQESLLCAAVEALRDATDPDRATAELARSTAAWDELASTDAAAIRRFAVATDAARARIEQRRGEVEAARAAERRREEALASRVELCRRVEALEGDEAPDRLGAIEAEWAALAPLDGYETDVAALASRFAKGVRGCRERHTRGVALREAREALAALVVEAEGLVTTDDTAAARWRNLSRDARGLVAKLNEASQPVSDLADRLAVVADAFEAQHKAARDADAKARRDQATKLGRLAERAKRAAASEAMTLREGDRLLRDLAAALEEVGGGAVAKDAREIVATLRTLHEQLAPRVKELRDMDDWRRFANVQAQEELIAMAEAIVASLKAEEEAGAESDLAATAKALRELHLRWRDVSEVPQHAGRRLWDRFKTATDFIRSRCEVHFAKQREERSANLAAREAIVVEAEGLAGSTDWTKTAARLQELQKSWDETGPVLRESGRDLARRFRAACNAFFTARRGVLSTQKKEWDENLARREALCERAEQLATSTDWDATASELKKLQAEWKTIGPVSHKQREAIWNRFRAAADAFFERYHDRHKLAAVEKVAEHAALVGTLEGFGALEDAPEDLAAQVQSLRTALTNLPRIESAEMSAVHERWRTALAALVGRWPAAFAGTDLDPAATHARLEKLLVKVERLLKGDEPAAAAPASNTASLAERLRSALAQNAMGVRPDESKWRAARKTVEESQDAWRRIALVPTDETRALAARFEAACARVMEQVKRHVRSVETFDEDREGRGRRDRREGGGRRGQRPPRGGRPGAPGGAGRPTDAKGR